MMMIQTTLDVRLMNLDNGLNINNVNWTFWGATKDPTLTAYKFGVAYPGSNGEIFVQGGIGTTTLIEDLVKFHPNTGSWEKGNIERNQILYNFTDAVFSFHCWHTASSSSFDVCFI